MENYKLEIDVNVKKIGRSAFIQDEKLFIHINEFQRLRTDPKVLSVRNYELKAFEADNPDDPKITIENGKYIAVFKNDKIEVKLPICIYGQSDKINIEVKSEKVMYLPIQVFKITELDIQGVIEVIESMANPELKSLMNRDRSTPVTNLQNLIKEASVIEGILKVISGVLQLKNSIDATLNCLNHYFGLMEKEGILDYYVPENTKFELKVSDKKAFRFVWFTIKLVNSEVVYNIFLNYFEITRNDYKEGSGLPSITMPEFPVFGMPQGNELVMEQEQALEPAKEEQSLHQELSLWDKLGINKVVFFKMIGSSKIHKTIVHAKSELVITFKIMLNGANEDVNLYNFGGCDYLYVSKDEIETNKKISIIEIIDNK